MAKCKNRIPTRVTTRAQAKSLQEDAKGRNKNNLKTIAKTPKRALKKRLSMENQRNGKKTPKVSKSQIKKRNRRNNQSRKYKNTDPLMIQIQKELNNLRKLNNDVHHEFLGDRDVTISESSTGRNIQITCKNFPVDNVKKNETDKDLKQIKDNSCNLNEASTIIMGSSKSLIQSVNGNNETLSVKSPIASTSSTDFNINNMPTPKYNPRLSLTTQCKLYLQDLQGINNLNDQPIKEVSSDESENDIICLDSTDQPELMDSIDNDVVCVTKLDEPSLIIIDDDDDKRTEKPHDDEVVDLVDLTTPIKGPNKIETSKRNQPEQQIGQQQMQIISITHRNNNPSTSTAKVHSNFPHVAARSMETPTFLISLPPRQQLESTNCNVSNYNSQSNIYGNNFLNFGAVRTVGLRPIFIDGNNVAMLHSNGKYFSVIGLKICIDYFKMRGHDVTAIVPQIRKKRKQNSNPSLLFRLEKDGYVIFTPSRVINGKNVIPYDDRFIVQLAAVQQGIVVSCDNYKDLLIENPNLRDVIENRVLNPTFVKNMIIFPSDPLGRYGPKLDDFLKFPNTS